MTYATIQQFRDMSIPTGSFDRTSDAQVEFALSASAGFIDGYLRPFHTLPLSSTPAELTYVNIVGASYQLILSRGFKDDSGDQVITDNYLFYFGKDGILSRIAKGIAPLLPATVDATPGKTEGTPKVIAVTTAPARGMGAQQTWCGKKFF